MTVVTTILTHSGNTIASFPGLCPDFISQSCFSPSCEIKSGWRPGDEASNTIGIRLISESEVLVKFGISETL